MYTFQTVSSGMITVYFDGEPAAQQLPIQAHDAYGMTLDDCVLCAAGEPMLHQFEQRPVVTTSIPQVTHDFVQDAEDPSSPYCTKVIGSHWCGLPAANRRHTRINHV